MKQAMWKKTAISSLALLMLAGGATSAFADGGNGDRDDDRERHEDKDDKDDDKYKITWQFEDEDDLKWAMEYIMRLASKGVFTGYEDGTFKPHQKISRIETLTAAVRLMGLREQAESAAEMNTDLQFKDAKKIESKYPWAVGYVAVALENDLFSETETEVKPEANATRLWSTILLIKALKLEDEAKALNNTKLDFKDAKEIPAGSVGYVALALQKGIITGYNDKNGKTFRPNQPVSRAELAALLDRTDTEMPDQDAQAITGKLKAAPADNKLTLVKADNTEAVLAIDSNVFIFRDDKKSPLSALRAGDEVLVRTYLNKVVFIEVTKSAPEVISFSELGVINTLTFNAQAKLATISISRIENFQTVVLIYNVDANVAITGDASLLKAGQLVQVKGENGTAKSIEIK
ncbi:S-layer homology domain-containing protein [Paenibacillus sp. Soil522]|uniref:S-layer homology domain-containing protein n=1 Tax=Paenibacillus sp. Soil522 TaxID=1736388 RepID=UPI0006FE6987|nr:S-layer homology domain-containing protein [Paenibacillus sp. Soil522]KRE51244.1 S-layer protein [Paenibacillus sp. Soil522]